MKVTVIKENKTLPIGATAEVVGEDLTMKQYRVLYEGRYYNLYMKDVELITIKALVKKKKTKRKKENVR